MGQHVLSLGEIDRSHVALVGGKGAHLGELSRLAGIRVPAGFCITTRAYERLLRETTSLRPLLDRLATLAHADRTAIGEVTADLRRTIEEAPIPGDVEAEVTQALALLGERPPCAVRSSATAEDSPTASHAGQQDTFLNIVGAARVLEHVRRCWASLFTERAVSYRLRNGVDHRSVQMAVVVQRMVHPHASGILFTADPVSGNRRTAIAEAGFGLGEALVSGLVNADAYRVQNGEIIERSIATKQFMLEASPGGGTRQRGIERQRQQRPALADAQVVRLVELGRRIEAHFGTPQDIEWCLVGDDFQIVQSRPITALFPVPRAPDGENRVYLSVGHQQMMTDALRPLGISFWKLTSPAPMVDAGGRLFVDVTPRLASPAARTALLDVVGRGDPLTRDALESILERGDFLRTVPDEGAPPPAAGVAPPPLPNDPAIVDELVARGQASIATLEREISDRSGTALLEFIRSDMQELRRILFDPRSHQAIMAGMEATWWLNDRLEEWLGERNAADALTLSAPHNITSEMGLALLDVADAIRPHPEVVAYLQRVQPDDGFLEELPKLAGGRAAQAAIVAWLERFGMRCIGEIDITRPRWRERPSTLVPLVLANLANFEPGEARRRFEQGRRQALAKRAEVLERLRALPGGEAAADETSRMIDRVRTFIGYREYPKYFMISRYFVYRRALLQEAGRLVQAGVLHEREDIYYLALQELEDVVRSGHLDETLVRERREAFRWHRSLTPPRVLTSAGEMLNGAYRRNDAPDGALVGLAVSAGTVEGRARVIRDVADANLEPGDILVTAGTDPSWTPLFVSIAALVTEVGGLMTHGAVIAREYGLPAVVGVQQATQLIRDGQRIRVHGTDGYVELLP